MGWVGVSSGKGLGGTPGGVALPGQSGDTELSAAWGLGAALRGFSIQIIVRGTECVGQGQPAAPLSAPLNAWPTVKLLQTLSSLFARLHS